MPAALQQSLLQSERGGCSRHHPDPVPSTHRHWCQTLGLHGARGHSRRQRGLSHPSALLLSVRCRHGAQGAGSPCARLCQQSRAEEGRLALPTLPACPTRPTCTNTEQPLLEVRRHWSHGTAMQQSNAAGKPQCHRASSSPRPGCDGGIQTSGELWDDALEAEGHREQQHSSTEGSSSEPDE